MTYITNTAAAPIKRCPKCGVLERVSAHRCDPAVVERYQRELRKAKPLVLETVL